MKVTIRVFIKSNYGPCFHVHVLDKGEKPEGTGNIICTLPDYLRDNVDALVREAKEILRINLTAYIKAVNTGVNLYAN